MNAAVNVAWTVMVLGGAGCVLAVVIADRAEIGRRLRDGWYLLAETAWWLAAAVLPPWTLRGRRPPHMDPHHPSVSAREARELEGLERLYRDVPAVADSERLTPRGDS